MKTLLKNRQRFDFFVKREYSLFQFFCSARGYIAILKSLLGIETTIRLESRENWISDYVIREHMDSFINHYASLIEKGEPFILKEIEELDKTGNIWISRSKTIAESSQKPDADLQLLLKEFWNLLYNHQTSLWKTFIIPEASNIVFNKLLAKYVPIEFHPKAITRYIKPSKKAHLLRLADELFQRSDLTNRVQFIKKHYPWIFTTDLFSPLPNDEQYVEYAKTFKKPEHKKFSSNELFSEEILPIIKTCQDIAYLKDHRDEYRRQAFFFIQPLVEKIIECYRVGRNDLWHIFPEELSLFEKDRGKILQDISERKIGYIFETDGKKTLFLQGQDARENFINEKEVLKGNEIKGIIGSPGRFKGEVQIIRNSEMCRNFKNGRILVATTTNPDYIAAMQKAPAFITDEGGITCHAAILARELKKPCIIGTKIATKVLKDGDEVEVNADNGTVKILKRAN